jgi:Calcineurin-like phosphoesterase
MRRVPLQIFPHTAELVQMLRAILVWMTVFFFFGVSCYAQSLHFSATGCGPYAPDEEPMLAHHVQLVNQEGKSQFLVHLGDIVTGKSRKWPEAQYATVANILKKSTRPVFVTLGDNEWNDLVNPNEGLEFWNRHFRDFEKHFSNSPALEKQNTRPENFAFVKHGVLVIGLNLVGGAVHDQLEWTTRMQQDADWVVAQFAIHHSDVRACVVLAQAQPSNKHELFFKQFAESCLKWKKPVLYLHADGHVWQVEKAWRAPNLWRVQTDQVRLNPPVLVTVTEDPSDPFQFDRRLDIGSRRELFVDHYLIDEHRGTSLKLHKPQPQEVALVCDAPWEGNTSAYFTLLADGDRFRMYYRGSHFDEQAKKSAHQEFTCYAESRDGLRWEKPKLGIVEFQGTKENNILLADEGTHNFTPFIDANPACKPDAKYKALAGDAKGLKAYKSADGLRWTLIQDKSVITKGNFDSQNLAFWHPTQGRYLAYHRMSRDGFRDIMMSVSADFAAWNDPRFLEYGDAPSEHLYTNAIAPYFRAPHLLVGFPTRFAPTTQQVEPIFMSSRDGLSFKRWNEALIPITAPKNRDGNRSNYMANGLLALPERGRELSLYATEAYYTGTGSRIRRFSMRTDGFVSVNAGDTDSEFVTKPFTFSGEQLKLNFLTVGSGSLRVEIQDDSGKPLSGYELTKSVPLVGDQIDYSALWKTDAENAKTEISSVAKLQNKPIRLRIVMQNADLFSIRFE